MGRRDSCPKCSQDSRVCLNCKFHDRSAYRECREEQAEWVKEKDRGNFCGWFEAIVQGKKEDPAASAKARLEAAFGVSEDPLPTANLAAELENFLKSKK
jgi:hypothetical protein